MPDRTEALLSRLKQAEGRLIAKTFRIEKVMPNPNVGVVFEGLVKSVLRENRLLPKVPKFYMGNYAWNRVPNGDTHMRAEFEMLLPNDYKVYGMAIGIGTPLTPDEYGPLRVDYVGVNIRSATAPKKFVVEYPYGQGVFEGGNPPEDVPDIAGSDLEVFTQAYVEAALFSSTTDDGTPLDKLYGITNINEPTLKVMKADAKRFLEENFEDIRHDLVLAGHDFWFTRNDHGAGFWDGDWPDLAGKRLTDAAGRFGEFNLFADGDWVNGG